MAAPEETSTWKQFQKILFAQRKHHLSTYHHYRGRMFQLLNSSHRLPVTKRGFASQLHFTSPYPSWTKRSFQAGSSAWRNGTSISQTIDSRPLALSCLSLVSTPWINSSWPRPSRLQKLKSAKYSQIFPISNNKNCYGKKCLVKSWGGRRGGGGAVFEVYTSFKMFSFLSKERG